MINSMKQQPMECALGVFVLASFMKGLTPSITLNKEKDHTSMSPKQIELEPSSQTAKMTSHSICHIVIPMAIL